ncbi:asparagine synthase (glutamine-hydrolyzing) [Nitrospira moscoviensis]|uniref:asparagine synthase (glutamine-hydrolyzing) n=1 Tax=Nitrospira moscoviensis TaxID=42253 RepID=A0A0K2GFQ5_NITMO|nr:asparagine synthase (glutamine-hydrolyzing) [Nitrospira moscoviensis]ALA59786.1 Asparagine synthetase [Nitrospira moscoviensis]
MCGLCGIFNVGTQEPVTAPLVKAMADTIVHRGPDAEGLYVSGPIGLAHRRLSIIDLEGGQQPMSSEDGSIVVVFNGEIYNFPELRQGLEQKGYRFKTRSDTEVILYLYQEVGEDCFRQLRGMFAIAIWDARNRRVVLGRDRVGKKPLFYCYDGKRCVFASEMKAILQVPGIRREVDIEALSDYFSLLYVPAPKSIFRHIRKVKPGHYAVISEAGFREVEYWDLTFAQVEERSEQDWIERLLELYQEAVRIRLMSDVPLGAFLSGGVDSSSVVAIMSRMMGEPVITSSIGFKDKEFDELDYARLIAKRFATKHHEQVVEPNAAAILDRLVWHYDEPFADSSAIPTYYVSKVAREHVTVALSGDGGDEFFAGYRRYLLDVRENALRERIPGAIRRAVFGPLSRIYPKADWAPRIFRGKATFESLACSHIEGYFRSVSACRPETKRQVLHPDVRRQLNGYDTLDLFKTYYDRAGTNDPLSRIQYVDVKTYLPDDILVKVDRASMANSLEVRAPLLDHRLIELTTRIPSSLKLRGTVGKYIFKKSLESLLPEDVLYRKKMGFAVPLASWLRHDLKPMAEAVLFPSQPDPMLDRQGVERLWTQHQSGLRDLSTPLWTILMYRLWQQRFGTANT